MRMKRDQNESTNQAAAGHHHIEYRCPVQALKGHKRLSGNRNNVQAKDIRGCNEHNEETRNLRRQNEMGNRGHPQEKQSPDTGR